jgi:hypothetical protein
MMRSCSTIFTPYIYMHIYLLFLVRFQKISKELNYLFKLHDRFLEKFNTTLEIWD